VPPERKKPERERPKLAPALPFIDAILEADRRAPRKQRHTAHRIWTRLRQEKPEIVVGESTVREYVRQRKQAMGLLGHEVFVAQSYQFGDEAQVDWYEIFAEIDGQQRKTYIFACVRWPPERPFIGPIRTPRSRHFLRPTSWHFAGLAGSFAP